MHPAKMLWKVLLVKQATAYRANGLPFHRHLGFATGDCYMVVTAVIGQVEITCEKLCFGAT
jgi:hypothetical protein